MLKVVKNVLKRVRSITPQCVYGTRYNITARRGLRGKIIMEPVSTRMETRLHGAGTN